MEHKIVARAVKAVRREVERHGLAVVAARLEVCERTVRRWDDGEGRPTRNTARRVVARLNGAGVSK